VRRGDRGRARPRDQDADRPDRRALRARMRTLLWIVVVLVIGCGAAYGIPLAAESSGTTCDAFEKRFVAVNAPARGNSGTAQDAADLARSFMGALQGVSKGGFATEYALRQYPNLPPGFGCVVLYWRTFLPGEKPRPA